jgi:hypothetical protein
MSKLIVEWLIMNAYSSSGDQFSRRLEQWIEEWTENAETEIRHAAAYVDAVVIPEVRRESSGALRTIAGHLERLAAKLHPDDGKRKQ